MLTNIEKLESIMELESKNEVYLELNYHENKIVYKRYPTSIYTSLAAIGGIFGLARILSSVLNYYHFVDFEKEV